MTEREERGQKTTKSIKECGHHSRRALLPKSKKKILTPLSSFSFFGARSMRARYHSPSENCPKRGGKERRREDGMKVIKREERKKKKKKQKKQKQKKK